MMRRRERSDDDAMAFRARMVAGSVRADDGRGADGHGMDRNEERRTDECSERMIRTERTTKDDAIDGRRRDNAMIHSHTTWRM